MKVLHKILEKNTQKAILYLADGTSYSGNSIGHPGDTIGEVVFNTGLTGYQEIISDPSYRRQLITMTYPHIGNYGINFEDFESNAQLAQGFIVKECETLPSNFRSKVSLTDFFKEKKIVAIEDIDTRALVRHIRSKGAVMGILSTTEFDKEVLAKKLKDFGHIGEMDLVKEVTTKKVYKKEGAGNKFRICVYDFGIKKSILDNLVKNGFSCDVVPADYPAKKVLEEKYDGVFLSNGPGNPEVCDYAIQNVKEIFGKIPMFGICLGHQIIALAYGFKTYKLLFGHRGTNHPVLDIETGKVEITSQNHGYSVDYKNQKEAILTHKSLNDTTVEGLSYPKHNCFSVQFHPEASPGPHDSRHLFSKFAELIGKAKSA